MKILVILLFFLSSLFGAPAYNKLRAFEQADGTSFMAKGNGNQHLNWIETEDGEILKYNPQTKNFEYAHIKENTLEATGVRYEKNNTKKSKAFHKINKIDKEELNKLWAQKQKEANLKRKAKSSCK